MKHSGRNRTQSHCKKIPYDDSYVLPMSEFSNFFQPSRSGPGRQYDPYENARLSIIRDSSLNAQWDPYIGPVSFLIS